MFLMAAAAGHGREDDAAVIKIFPGVDLPELVSNGVAMTMLLGCIADDFTGATDLANMLVRGGMRTIQTIGVPAAPLNEEVDAVVVALKSRTIPASRGGCAVAGGAGVAEGGRLPSRSISSTARPSTRRPRATSAPSPTR